MSPKNHMVTLHPKHMNCRKYSNGLLIIDLYIKCWHIKDKNYTQCANLSWKHFFQDTFRKMTTIFLHETCKLKWLHILEKTFSDYHCTAYTLPQPFCLKLVDKESLWITYFNSLKHYMIHSRYVVFEGRVVFGGHLPVHMSNTYQV